MNSETLRNSTIFFQWGPMPPCFRNYKVVYLEVCNEVSEIKVFSSRLHFGIVCMMIKVIMRLFWRAIWCENFTKMLIFLSVKYVHEIFCFIWVMETDWIHCWLSHYPGACLNLLLVSRSTLSGIIWRKFLSSYWLFTSRRGHLRFCIISPYVGEVGLCSWGIQDEWWRRFTCSRWRLLLVEFCFLYVRFCRSFSTATVSGLINFQSISKSSVGIRSVW